MRLSEMLRNAPGWSIRAVKQEASEPWRFSKQGRARAHSQVCAVGREWVGAGHTRLGDQQEAQKDNVFWGPDGRSQDREPRRIQGSRAEWA